MEDKLSNLIARYNADKELNNLKDILDYLQSKSFYIYTTIKISKKKLKQIPKDDLLMILNNISIINNRQYFSVYSNNSFTSNQSYCLEVNMIDCLQFMKKMAKTDEIIIDPNTENSLILDKNTIKYLKYYR